MPHDHPHSLTVLSPSGMLGYGIPEDSLERALDGNDIDYIACDSGSIDQGPEYLGRGKFLADEAMMKRDIRLLLNARDRLDVPLLIGTAGGSGAAPHLEATVDLFHEVAAEEDLSFDLARIYTDVARDLFKRKLDKGHVRTIDYDADLDDEDVDATAELVGQVGPEPFQTALETGADVVLGGRSIDEAPFAAIPLDVEFDPGLVFHMAKILECGAMSSEPQSGSDCLVATLESDSFTVEPSNPDRRCTPTSVAAHTLYEKADPTTIHLPSGEVDVSVSAYEAVSDRAVRVSGSEFTPSSDYSVLVEGVRKVGYRAITPAGIRGETAVEKIDDIIERTLEKVHETVEYDDSAYDINVRRYGLDAVPVTPVEQLDPSAELGIIIDVVGDDQETANAVCGIARSSMLHQSYEGRRAISGNLAIPYSPADIELGPTYEFSVHHLLQPVDPDEIAEIETEVVG